MNISINPTIADEERKKRQEVINKEIREVLKQIKEKTIKPKLPPRRLEDPRF